MFGNRRRRATSNPPLNGSNVNPSAATAAAQAFLSNRASNASLSSAAAAAALRSRPMTPTSVADVQTKRTLRRSASNASVGSSVSGSIRPGLERKGSGSSMTERTFRNSSPSPSRSQGVLSALDAPPVPAIPQHMQQQTQTQAIPSKSHRRAASLEAPTMRVASPPPNQGTGRGSSLGPTGTGTMQPARRPGHAQRSSLPSVQELTGAERQARRGSVNFSLPTSSRHTSPTEQRQLTYTPPQRANLPRITVSNTQDLVYDPNTRSFLPAAELQAIEMRIQAAANQPTKKKRRVPPAAGTHLADGTVGGRPRGTVVDAMEDAMEAAAQRPEPVEQQLPPVTISQPVVPQELESTTTTRKKKKKKKVMISEPDSDQGSQNMSASDTDSIVSQPNIFNTRAGAPLAKKPSIVREDREREEAEDDTPLRRKTEDGLKVNTNSFARARQEVSPSPLPRSVAGRGQASASAAYAQDRQQGGATSQPPPESPADMNEIGLAFSDSIRGARVQSVSPARTTHFATNTDNLVVRHQPPPRSISPRKSALKHSNSPRGPSPIELSGAPVSQNLSEASTAVNTEPDELAAPKKKPNRVSFDETNVLVGQAAPQFSTDSPVVPSPQAKRSWFSISRGKRKEPAPVEDDEVMKPRPALPSFGSVREKKNREAEPERVLVKPAEFMEHKQPPVSPPLLAASTGEVIEYPLGPSNDHVVGAVLSQDAASKNTANMAKSREPLPPHVTSVEGSGYVSDSDSSSYSLENNKSDVGIVRADSVKRGPGDADAETYRGLASPTVQDDDLTPTPKGNPLEEQQKTHATPNNNIPEIAIQAPTPKTEQDERREWPEMPGAWESSDSGSQNQEQDIPAAIVEHHVTDPSPADIGIAEPAPKASPPGSPGLGQIAAQNSHPPILEEPEESETSSIYSDAAEDLSDLEGDGFQSLNAVVESPVSKIAVPVGLAITTPPESPTPKGLKEKAYQKSGLSRRDSEPGVEAGWQKAQEYWSNLSAEKKKQIELQAQEEAEGSDTEVEVKLIPKPKRKKKGIAQPVPAQQPRQVQQVQPFYINDRSYMIQPGSKAAPNGPAPLKTSMQVEPPSTAADTRIRKSMRRPAAGSMRGSMRGSSDTVDPRGSLQKKYRPMSHPAPQNAKSEHDEQVRQHIKALSIASAAAASKKQAAPAVQPPGLRRRGSGDSDSSFKRARANSDVPSFRRSMRGSDISETSGRPGSSMRGSSRFSLRSLSPSGSGLRQPFNSAPPVSFQQTQMRTSMRESPPSKSKGFFGSGASKPAKKLTSRPRSSRFADSSDEEDERPAFRSRFVDSSDEDEPLPVAKPSALGARTMRANAPVRGIPKRAGAEDGDSTDLSDSDDEQPNSPGLKLNKKRGQNGSAATTSNQGATLSSGSLRRSGSGRGMISIPPAMVNGNGEATTVLRTNKERRGSFLSILRRKKPDPSHKIRKSDAESPARRDTPLERSKSDLAAIKHDRPTSPKLQKRNTMSRENSGAWPLPAPQPLRVETGDEDERPFRADDEDGVVGGMVEGKSVVNGNENVRPELGARRFTATGLGDVDLNGGALGGGRKKKFGRLRRLFGLDG